ncbi:MAG: alpha/beta fold hydrolase [Verrucomicrobiales bacterium]|nr:alpha/beta fold hydrolase [Verrucomicrobiales bacterium]
MRRLLKSVVVGLLPCLLWTDVRAQAPVEILTVDRSTNGVRVTWSASSPGQAYTVQVRESLANGTWRNATTRYRWPSALTHWMDVPVNLPSTRFYRVASQAVAEPHRGKLLTGSLRDQFDLSTVKAYLAEQGVGDFVVAKYGVANRPFTYETIDPWGLPITASAVMVLPRGTNGPLPLVSVQHESMVMPDAAPSRTIDAPNYLWAAVFASLGYAVVMPDFLGLGSSPGYQAYLHAKSEGTCVVDALRAGIALCASNNVSLNGQLFLTGFSQGGHVTMAAHREIETFHAAEFTVTAVAPSSGPYDLGGVGVETVINDPNYPGPWVIPVLVASYLPIYGFGETLEEVLGEPYRKTLPRLLDGSHNRGELAQATPSDSFAILRPDFQADFRTNAANPFRQALRENNTYAWSPKAPVKMFHCRGDRDVDFANAEIAQASFVEQGACCTSVVDPGAPERLDHPGCYLPSLKGTLEWFESLRR